MLTYTVVGVVTSMALSVIDERYGITDRVVAGLDEISGSAQSYAERTKNNLQDKANDAITSVIDYAIEASQRAVVNFARHQINKFLSNRPRVY